MNEKQFFEVMLPVAPKDISKLDLSVPKILENICPQKIVIIAAKQFKDRIPKIDKVEFIDEDQLIENLTMDNVKRIMIEIKGTDTRSNWYFQQFLKMAYAFQCSTSYYLIWDSDTIPLRNIQFWKNIDGVERCLFGEHHNSHQPCLDTLNTLFNGKVKRLFKKSFIVEHMMINQKVMKEIIHDIEMNDQLQGKCFYEKILYAVNKKDIEYGAFSEFETYGNYVLNFYPEMYAIRKLKAYRQGGMVIEQSQINNEVLNWVAKDYDTVSFEELHGYNRIFTFLRKKGVPCIQRKKVSFKTYQYPFYALERLALLIHAVSKILKS
jgi:hypothetical protein